MNKNFCPPTVTIRIPHSLQKKIWAEVPKRYFRKPNGEPNENEFINKILPNLLAFRNEKRGRLRKYLKDKIQASIAKGMQDSVLDLICESFDHVYFEKLDEECDCTLTLRLDVDRHAMYASLFDRLEHMGIARSAYLRNLFCEYFNFSNELRERICFKEEYDTLKTAMEEEKIFRFDVGGVAIDAIAVSLEFSVLESHEHWYLLYFRENKFDVLYALPLYLIRNVALLHEPQSTPPSEIADRIHAIVESGIYCQKGEFNMRGENDA